MSDHALRARSRPIGLDRRGSPAGPRARPPIPKDDAMVYGAQGEMPVVRTFCVFIALTPCFGYASIFDRRSDGEDNYAWQRNGGSDKCDGIPMDSLITAAARALAAGDLLGV